MTMELTIKKAGMLTSVQDLGRWGYQSSGVPVAGAMDLPALRIGNAMLGNPEGAAALEVTLLGPEIEVSGGGAGRWDRGRPSCLTTATSFRLPGRRAPAAAAIYALRAAWMSR